MPERWYVTREDVKEALSIVGASRNRQVDRACGAGSNAVEELLRRHFIPTTEIRKYDWPQRDAAGAYILSLDGDLIAATAVTRDGTDETAVGDYLLKPNNFGPPYSSIEIDLSSTGYFSQGASHQQQIWVTGRWGHSENTESAGALVGGINETVEALDVSDASLVDVGDTLLLDDEHITVRERSTKDTETNLAADLTRDADAVAVTVGDGSKILPGEVMLIEAEKMYVESVTGAVCAVERGHDGTLITEHTGSLDIYNYRTLTVERAKDGTTGATHSDSLAIARFRPPELVRNLARALAITNYSEAQGGWRGELGGGEGSIERRATILESLKKDAKKAYGRPYLVAV